MGSLGGISIIRIVRLVKPQSHRGESFKSEYIEWIRQFPNVPRYLLCILKSFPVDGRENLIVAFEDSRVKLWPNGKFMI